MRGVFVGHAYCAMFFEDVLNNINENLRKECECDSLY